MEVSEEINDSSTIFIKEKEDGVIGQTTVALSSCDNADSAPTSGGNTNERVERKKKTRRGKPKGKNYKPYNKAPNKDVDMKMKRSRQRVNSRLTYDQPEAPNNSNQFIIEDHNFHQIPIDSPERPNQRKCYRDSSFTSVESDGENFYSSPEDEVDYIIQDFSATYKNLREETLGGMSKNDLIRQVLSLEEKIETLVKKKKCTEDDLEVVGQEDVIDKLKSLEYENSWLKKEVDRLTTENSSLRRRCRSSESSIDSESDSSSSSSSTSDSSTSSSKPNSPVPVLVNGAAQENENAVVTNMEEDLVEMNIAVIQSNGTAEKQLESNGIGERSVLSNDTSEKSPNDNV